MKRKNVTIIAVYFGVLVIIAIIIVGYLQNILGYPHVAKGQIVEEYKNNKDAFIGISNYAEGINENVTIDKDNKNKYVISKIEGSQITDFKADNKKLSDSILYLLYKLKFKHVIKEDNGVYFLRQTDVGFEQGIVFLKNGSKPNWPLITVLEPIEGNWYYYESK